MAGDGLPLLSHVKVHWDNEEPRAGGFPLIWFSCAMECAGTPGPFNGPFDSALGLGDNGRSEWCMWEEMQIRADPNL